MGRDAQGPAGDDADVSAYPAGRIGRVRVVEEGALPPAVEPVGTEDTEGNGWSPLGFALGVLALAIIVGALFLILWGSFRS